MHVLCSFGASETANCTYTKTHGIKCPESREELLIKMRVYEMEIPKSQTDQKLMNKFKD